jgi:hypothetical protein
MNILVLPPPSDFEIRLQDHNKKDIGTVTIDQLDQWHTDASKLHNESGASILTLITQMVQEHLGLEYFPEVVVALLLQHKQEVISQLKKSIADISAASSITTPDTPPNPNLNGG